MFVRPYRESDLAALRQIHSSQDFPYAFPDLNNALFLTKIVLTDKDDAHRDATEAQSDSAADNIVGAAFLRLTAEAYLLLDPQLTKPRQRWQGLLKLHEAARLDAQRRGLEDVHAWLPPRIGKTFGRRLERLGWRRDDDWTPYCKRFYE
ncbi:MAG TPA: hypothetical protein VIW21_11730 [Chthoniobacterales bacterium]|jgi:hypothetical protein